MKWGLLNLVIDSLASYRLTKLVRDDMITQPLRDAVEARQGPPDESKVSYLLHCPWCLSVYFGLALTTGRHHRPGPTGLLARGLAISAVTGIIAELEARAPSPRE